jgi:hypothetical protein
MRRIIAVGLAGLLAFSVAVPPVSAADLTPPPIMPVKAPAVVEAPPPDYTWLWVVGGLVVVGAVFGGLCLARDVICTPSGPSPPVTNGGTSSSSGSDS